MMLSGMAWSLSKTYSNAENIMEDAKRRIERLRKEIDKIDDQLLPLLNERARLAIDIGHIKRKINLAVFDAQREEQVISHIVSKNNGPLEDERLIRLFKAIIAESRGLEKEESAKKE